MGQEGYLYALKRGDFGRFLGKMRFGGVGQQMRLGIAGAGEEF